MPGLVVMAGRQLCSVSLVEACDVSCDTSRLICWKAYVPLECHALPSAKRLYCSLRDGGSAGCCSGTNSKAVVIEGGLRHSSC